MPSAETVMVLNSLPEPAFAVSLDKRMLAMNGAAEALTGITAEAAKGRSCADIVRCEACGDRCPGDAAFEQGRAVTSFNVRLKSVHGDEPVSLHTAPMRNASGEIFAALECARPVGHLVALFEALQERTGQAQLERDKTQTVLDSIGDGVLTVDRECMVTSVNHSAARIVGRPESEIAGKKCWETLSCTADCGQACELARVLSEGHAVTNFETEVCDRRGRSIAVSLGISALRNEREEIVGAVVVFRDLRNLVSTSISHAPIVYGSARMRRTMELVEVLKDSDATILLEGESGTGKGLLAATIHSLGKRAQRPFVKVNCGALPEGLLESELFGHVKGSFTGAIRDTVGRLELADGGTVFLDEVGALSLSSQLRLLRFLQEQEFERVGSTKTVRVNVRVIAATNHDLRDLMAQGRLRADLFYRLNVIPVELPPLRERADDIPALVEHILARLTLKSHKVKSLAPAVMETLLRYPWPGNIRELENTLEHAMVCCKGSVIELGALPRSVLVPDAAVTKRARKHDGKLTLDTLAQHGGNQSSAARALGISRTTLWRRLRKLGASQDRLLQ